jgi:SAM-dependent methyltransferase
MKTYCIEPTYTHRDEAPYFDDTPFKDEFQPEVYEYAERVADSLKPHTVIDLGCGSGFKLMKHFAHLHTIGIDLKPTIEFCLKTYPNRMWAVSGSPLRYVRPA